MKLTPWFSANQRPVRDGVYERMFPWSAYCFAIYRNGRWHCGDDKSAKEAARRNVISHWQKLPWRGVMK